MLSIQGPLLCAALLLTSTASAASIPISSLFARQGTCSPCEQVGLPSSFCCPASMSCGVVAGNTTIICCPKGDTCNKIRPITCDIEQQDATLHPEAQVKTTALKAILPQCGVNCCPFGYTCEASTTCIRDADQSTAPVTPSTPSPSPSAAPASTDNGTKTMSIVGGVVGGVVALIAIAIAVWVLLGKKKKRDSESDLKLTRSTSSFGNIISTPIAISAPTLESEESAYRTDFIRKSPAQQQQPQPRSPIYSLKDRLGSLRSPGLGLGIKKDRPASEASKSGHGNVNRPMSTWSRDSTVAVAPIRGMRSPPRNNGRLGTPESAHMPSMPGTPGGFGSARMPSMPETPRGQREPSMEINIFADPSTVGRRARRGSDTGTTFTHLMREADLGDPTKGEPFVPNSLAGTPASMRR